MTTAAGRRVVMEIRSAASYLSANDARVVAGLGSAQEPVPRIEVRWPDGLVEVFEGLAVDCYHKLQRGTSGR